MSVAGGGIAVPSLLSGSDGLTPCGSIGSDDGESEVSSDLPSDVGGVLFRLHRRQGSIVICIIWLIWRCTQFLQMVEMPFPESTPARFTRLVTGPNCLATTPRSQLSPGLKFSAITAWPACRVRRRAC